MAALDRWRLGFGGALVAFGLVGVGVQLWSRDRRLILPGALLVMGLVVAGVTLSDYKAIGIGEVRAQQPVDAPGAGPVSLALDQNQDHVLDASLTPAVKSALRQAGAQLVEERSSGHTLVRVYELNAVKTRAFLEAGTAPPDDDVGGRNAAVIWRSVQLVGGLSEFTSGSAAPAIVRVEYQGSTVRALMAGYS